VSSKFKKGLQLANVLVTRSRNADIATSYLAAYAAQLVDKAIQMGHTVTDLYGSEVTLENFEAEIEAHNIFLGYGHGSKSIFLGSKINEHSEVLLKAGVNSNLLSGKKVNLTSCLTGITLGPKMVEETALEFYGYVGDWVFVYHPEYYPDRVLEDPYAQAFFDTALTTGCAVLSGKSPLEVFSETVARYEYWWNYWIRQEDVMADDILTWLNWDRKNFIAITPDGLYAPTVKAKAGNLLYLALPLSAALGFLIISDRMEK